jgi:hypothetical protein
MLEDKPGFVASLSRFLTRIAQIPDLWCDSDEELRLWFRGQTNAEWHLIPKFFRYEDADEDEIRSEFQRRAWQLGTKTSEKGQRLLLTALRFACLAANQKAEDARAVGGELAKDISGLKKVRWSFRGVEHFMSQHPAFAAKGTDWVRLFEALEQGDEEKARASLVALGVPQ